MSEQTLTEALEDIDVDIDLDISDEDIERAALPANKRVEEEVQDESTYIDLSEEEVEDISPVTEDEIEEDSSIVISVANTIRLFYTNPEKLFNSLKKEEVA